MAIELEENGSVIAVTMSRPPLSKDDLGPLKQLVTQEVVDTFRPRKYYVQLPTNIRLTPDDCEVINFGKTAVEEDGKITPVLCGMKFKLIGDPQQAGLPTKKFKM